MNLINFDLQKAKSGYSIVTVDGSPIHEFAYFSTVEDPFNCVAVVKGHLLFYDKHGFRPKKHWNSPDCLDLKLVAKAEDLQAI